MAGENRSIPFAQPELVTVNRLDGAVNVFKIFGVDAAINDSSELAIDGFQAPGKDDRLLSVDPVGNGERRADLGVAAVARILEVIAVGNVDGGGRPGGGRYRQLAVAVGNSDIESLLQAAELVDQRVAHAAAIECVAEAGLRIDIQILG